MTHKQVGVFSSTSPADLPRTVFRCPYRDLLDAAQATGQNVDVLRDICWRIHVHPSLTALPRIAKNLLNILTLLRDQVHVDLASHRMEECLPVLEWLAADEHVAAILSETRWKRKRKGNPLLGKSAISHAIFTLLWHIHPDPNYADIYAMAQGHLVLPYAAYNAQLTTLDNYERYVLDGATLNVNGHSVYSAALALRYLSRRDPSALALLESLPITLPPDRFVQALHLISSSYSREAVRRKRDLYLYLRKIQMQVPYVRRAFSHRHGGGGSRWFLDEGGDEEITGAITSKVGDEDSSTGAITQTSIPDLSANGQSAKDEARQADASPGELTGNESFHLFEGEGENTQDQPRLQIASRAQMRAMGRPAHLMAWNKRTLSNAELRPLLRGALKALPPDGTRYRHHSAERQALCLSLVSLFTGRPLAEAVGLWIFNATTRSRDTDLAVFLGDDPSGAKDRWRFSVLCPGYRTQDLSTEGQAHVPEDYLWLPLPRILSMVLRTHIETKSLIGEPNPLSGAQPPRRLFVLLPEIKRAVRDLLRTLDPSGRLTAARIETTLPSRLIAQSGGDVSLASMVFCRAHPLARTELYYDGIFTSEAIQAYRQLIGPMERECLPELAPAMLPVGTSANSGYIGCRYTPTSETMLAAIQHVKHEAAQVLHWPLKDQNVDGAEFVRAHNFYTLYMVSWMGFACGIRAVTTPLVRPQDVHTKTGICHFRDKDDRFGYKARLLWVPPALLAQIQHYDTHVSEICRVLHFPNAMRRIAGFFLDGRGRPELIRPASIYRITREFFPFPANAHRRVMRQALRRSSCPPEIIRAWMGHWNTDQEPWSDFSGHSMQSICNEFAQYIPPLLLFFGFGPLQCLKERP